MMMMMMTVEEENILSGYMHDNPGKQELLERLRELLLFVGDREMICLIRRTINRIEKMTDEEYHDLMPFAADEA